ncbi:hypothetical protein Tco_0564124 [Tanacetum coccineum]
MAKTMEQCMTKTRDDYGSGIARQKFDDKAKFEFKGQFLKELLENTFSRSDNGDANEHIERVLEIADLFTVPDVTQDQLMLRIFPISLTGVASRWIRNKPVGSITTWEILKGKFSSKYCPPARTAKKMEEINNFQQEPDETLYQAWERFKELLMRCPQHYLTDMQEVILFYKGLDVPTRQILDSKGVVPSMNAANAKKVIQEMAGYSQKWHSGTSTRGKSSDTSDGLAAIPVQLNNLGREIKKVNKKVYAAQVGCELCKGPHYTKDFSLKEEGKHLKKHITLDLMHHTPKEEDIEQLPRDSSKEMEIRALTDAKIRNQEASIKALKIQIGQISKVLKERGSRSLLSSTETNPRDHVKSITTIDECKISSIRRIQPNRYGVSNEQKDDRLSLTEINQANIPFLGRLKEYSYDENEILKEFKKLQVRKLVPTELIIELADRTVKRPKGIEKNVLVGIDKFVFLVDFVILDMPDDPKTPLILGRSVLSTTHAKIDVFKRKFSLRVRNDKLVFKSNNPTNHIVMKVYALGLRERMELDLEARLMLRNHENEDLGPTIDEGEIIDELNGNMVETSDDKMMNENVDEYPMYVDARRSDRLIPIYNGNSSVTYQMARTHPRPQYGVSSNMDTAYRLPVQF